MSSTYRILCLSHDPAIVIDRDYTSRDDAGEAIADVVAEHPLCDLVIGRYSCPLVEVACLSRDRRGGGPDCRHKYGEWAQSEWLRLLARAYDSTDPRVVDAAQKGRFTCWPPDRLRRLRHELGLDEETP